MAKCNAINKDILKWARERAAFSCEKAIKDIHKNIIAWEDGEGYPTYKQLETIAQKYKRPVALFFFPKPPEEKDLQQSFRTVPEYQISELSPKIRFLLREAETMQLNLYDLDSIETIKRKDILNLVDAKNFDIEQVVNKLRITLDFSLEQHKKLKGGKNAFNFYRDKFGECGIFVFKEAFKDNDIAGFCLYDAKFPIIYINNSLPDTRQLFTLFHELAHLLFETSDINFITEKNSQYLQEKYEKIEIFCNKFAAYFLVPDKDFKQYLNMDITEEDIANIAKLYNVSREVILRKLYDNNKIPQKLYNEWSVRWKEQYKKVKKKPSGGNPYYTQLSYLGDQYVNFVFSSYYRNILSKIQAADFLNIKPKNIENMEHYFLRRQMT